MTSGDDRTRRVPVVALATAGLVVLVAVGAAFVGAFDFTGPRWLPGGSSTPPPIVQSNTPAPAPTGTPAPAKAGNAPDLTWLVLVVAGLAVLVIAFFVVRWLLRRRRDRADARPSELDEVAGLDPMVDDPSVETSMPYLRRGLRRALDALDGDREPTDAIIQAWLGLQEAAEDAGFHREAAETPTEFTTRILRQVEVDPAALATLRRLYLAVRFGDARATAADVGDARTALETLQAQWAAESAS